MKKYVIGLLLALSACESPTNRKLPPNRLAAKDPPSYESRMLSEARQATGTPGDGGPEHLERDQRAGVMLADGSAYYVDSTTGLTYSRSLKTPPPDALAPLPDELLAHLELNAHRRPHLLIVHGPNAETVAEDVNQLLGRGWVLDGPLQTQSIGAGKFEYIQAVNGSY